MFILLIIILLLVIFVALSVSTNKINPETEQYLQDLSQRFIKALKTVKFSEFEKILLNQEGVKAIASGAKISDAGVRKTLRELKGEQREAFNFTCQWVSEKRFDLKKLRIESINTQKWNREKGIKEYLISIEVNDGVREVTIDFFVRQGHKKLYVLPETIDFFLESSTEFDAFLSKGKEDKTIMAAFQRYKMAGHDSSETSDTVATYFPSELTPVLTQQALNKVESDLGTELPQDLRDFYQHEGNGINKASHEKFDLFNAQRIVNLVTFFQAQMNEHENGYGGTIDIFKKSVGGEPWTVEQAQKVTQASKNYFVYAVSWGSDGYSPILLMFDKSGQYFAWQASFYEEMMFYESLENFKDFKKNSSLKAYMTRFVDMLLDENCLCRESEIITELAIQY